MSPPEVKSLAIDSVSRNKMPLKIIKFDVNSKNGSRVLVIIPRTMRQTMR